MPYNGALFAVLRFLRRNILKKKNQKIGIALYAVIFVIVLAAGIFLDKYTSSKIVIRTSDLKTEATIMPSSDMPAVIDGKININTADAEQLKTVKGIGDATAEKIIEYREKYGRFLSLANIMDIPGIGQSKYEEMKDQLCAE